MELEIAQRENRVAIGDAQRIEQLKQARQQQETERDTLSRRWEQERALVDEVIALRAQLQEADDDAEPALRQTLNEKQLALKKPCRVRCRCCSRR